MTFWLALRRLLPLLAVLSLALAPVTASAAAAGMSARRAAVRAITATPWRCMPTTPWTTWPGWPWTTCRAAPEERPDMPDCSKGCPLMALCLAKVATGLPVGVGLPGRVAGVEGAVLGRHRLLRQPVARAAAPSLPEPEPDAAGACAGTMPRALRPGPIVFRRSSTVTKTPFRARLHGCAARPRPDVAAARADTKDYGSNSCSRRPRRRGRPRRPPRRQAHGQAGDRTP